jgi:hypothetical protein
MSASPISPRTSSVIESYELPYGYYFQMTDGRDCIVAYFPMKRIRSKSGLCVSANVGNSYVALLVVSKASANLSLRPAQYKDQSFLSLLP